MADRLNYEALQGYYAKMIAAIQPRLSDLDIRSLRANATSIAIEHFKEHPYSTTFSVVSVSLTPFLGYGWVTAPVLRLLGFTPLGPAAGEP